MAADGAGTLSELDAELEVLEQEQADARRFDTVLAQAMPRPATREQFLAVTGWIPTIWTPSTRRT